jgi:hypothetical protein
MYFFSFEKKKTENACLRECLHSAFTPESKDFFLRECFGAHSKLTKFVGCEMLCIRKKMALVSGRMTL